MEKLNVTKGNWKADTLKTFGNGESIVVSDLKGRIIELNPDIFESEHQMQSNAILIADAGTTYNKCEKLPSELFAENKELIEFIKRISIYDTTVKNMFDVKKEAKQLINKQTK